MLSTKADMKLDPLFTIGVLLGFLMAGLAVHYGMQRPTNTLPVLTANGDQTHLDCQGPQLRG